MEAEKYQHVMISKRDQQKAGRAVAELTIDQALQQGIEAHKAGQVQEADRLYTAILKAQPKHPDANHNMGVLAVGIGKVQEALPFLKAALEANPATAQFWLSYIDALIKLDKLAEAQAVLDQAKSKGAKGDGIDKLEQSLNEASKRYSTDDTLTETPETNQSCTLDIAIQLRDSGEFNQAIDLLKDEKNQFPETADILALLSHCYLLADQVQEAKVHLEKATTIAPDSASVGWNTARLTLKEKKLSEALNIARDTSQRFPDDVEGMGVLGGCLRANGEMVESLEVLTKAIELNPDYAEALINRGLIRLSQENKPEALADLELAHRLKPHIKQIWDLVVGLKVEAQDYTDAILLLINMIEIVPEDEKRLATLALCYQYLENFDAAIEAYDKSLAIKPNNADAYGNMGVTLQKQGKLEEAIEAYKRAIAINPSYANVYNNMGNALKEQGKPEEAIEAYKKALAIEPDNADVFNNMGVTLQEQGKLEEAIEAYIKALVINPEYAEAYSNMGVTLQDQGRLGEALEAYNKALTIEPDNAEAFNNLGNVLKEQGKLEEAIQAYSKALAIKPYYSEAHSNIGVTLQHQGKLEDAIEAYSKALAIKPDNVDAHLGLNSAQKQLVPAWHLEMMNDSSRNRAYLDAIKLAVTEDDFVLEIGTGSGLLAMMAAESGSKQIVTCESSKTISQIAKKIISENNYDDVIKVINKKSTELIVGEDLPRRADVIISEVLSAEFVGEGVQTTILDANKRLLKKNGKMLPKSGDIRIALLGEDAEINGNVTVGKVCGFDLSKFNLISGNKFTPKIQNKPSLLSETEIAFKLNLYGADRIIKKQKILNLTVQKSGTCLGVIQWLGIQIFKDIEYQNKPGEIISHWPTPIYMFESPKAVIAGDVIKIRASLFKDAVWFQCIE